jgi:hypothetical protein
MKKNGTPIYARQHKRGLTLPQLTAVDLLASGKTDTETAELLSLSRTCVSKWRLYDPIFQAGGWPKKATIKKRRSMKKNVSGRLWTPKGEERPVPQPRRSLSPQAGGAGRDGG